MHEALPHRSLKERQRHEREDLILRTAEEVFSEKGYHDASMEEIATRVGIAKGTLYLHFARKEDLVQAILLRKLLFLKQAIEQIVSLDEPVQERLTAIMRFLYMELYGSYLRMIYTVFNSTELHSLLREKRSQIYAEFMPMVERLNTLFEEGKASGIFDAAMPTPIMFSLFVSMLSPQAYRHLVVESQVPVDELFTCVHRAFFKAIGAAREVTYNDTTLQA